MSNLPFSASASTGLLELFDYVCQFFDSHVYPLKPNEKSFWDPSNKPPNTMGHVWLGHPKLQLVLHAFSGPDGDYGR